MFKNRALQVRVVKTNQNEDFFAEPIEMPSVDPEKINQILTEQMQNVAKAVGGLLILSFVLNTTSELIVRSMEHRYNK